MSKLSSSIILTCLFGLISGMLSAQSDAYKIEVKINGLSNENVILGHYLGKSMYPDDTASLDKQGYGVFTKDKVLTQGLYVIFMPNGSYFEVIMGADQEFSIETDTIDYIGNISFKGSENNSLFSEFQRYMIKKRREMTNLQAKLKEAGSDEEKEKLKNEIIALDNERKSKASKLTEKHPELFVTTFLKATMEVQIPEEIREDQQKSYTYYREHYFDNFDLSDVRLLNTPLYEDKMMNYLDKVVLQIPDSLIKEIDIIIEKSRADSALFRHNLIALFNKYGKSNLMGMDAVQVHLADKYYLTDAWWSSEEFLSDLKERIDKVKPLLINNVAPDPELRAVPADHFKLAANDTALKKYPHAGSFFFISQIPADYTVLVFWEATCSHCKKVVPQLHTIYQDTLKALNTEVIAISTMFGEDGKEKWIDFVNKHELYDWVNAWNPYDYKYKELFDIRSTPQIFILDKDKKIIGKKLGPENIVELINAYNKHKDKE